MVYEPYAAKNPSMASDVVACFPAEELWVTASFVTQETTSTSED